MDSCKEKAIVEEEHMEEKFNLFMGTVDVCFRDFVGQINDCLIQRGCNCEIKTAKSGYTVSYTLDKKDFSDFCFPENRNETPNLSRAHTRISRLS